MTLGDGGQQADFDDIAGRLDRLDWSRVERQLDEAGNAILDGLLSASECRALADLYAEEQRFRSRVVMQRHGFGQGEYQYFRYPLPDPVQALRQGLYPRLAGTANRWMEALRADIKFPETLDRLLAQCQTQGQVQPTPLLIRYRQGDYNCLHQDVYGAAFFPLQLTVLLSEPERDFTGGEFVLTEQRPRMQSRVEVVPLRRGDAVIFAGRHRPRLGTRGYHSVNLRHGVSRLRSGQRFTLGIIFHDAQ